MRPRFFDIHTHVQFPAYDADRVEVLKRAADAGVWMANVGTTFETSRRAIELAHTEGEGVFAIVGIHPTHSEPSHADPAELGDIAKAGLPTTSEIFDAKVMSKLATDQKVVAIGECGLDYFRMTGQTRGKQEKLFREHIELAKEVNKPLMLHVRPGAGSSAYDDALAILKDYDHPKSDFHFFAGSYDEAKRIVDAGHMISFSGVITFARNYDEVIKKVPLDRIMAETDAPYVAPKSHRGKRNEPSYVVETYEAVASIRGEDAEVVREVLLSNSRRFFGV